MLLWCFTRFTRFDWTDVSMTVFWIHLKIMTVVTRHWRYLWLT